MKAFYFSIIMGKFLIFGIEHVKLFAPFTASIFLDLRIDCFFKEQILRLELAEIYIVPHAGYLHREFGGWRCRKNADYRICG